MTWPRLWRLWQEPAPNTQWADGHGLILWVHYCEGGSPRRVFVCEMETGGLHYGVGRWARPRGIALWAFRAAWVWMREVPR